MTVRMMLGISIPFFKVVRETARNQNLKLKKILLFLKPHSNGSQCLHGVYVLELVEIHCIC